MKVEELSTQISRNGQPLKSGCYIINDIKDGDKVPVSNCNTMYIIADLNHFEDFFEKISKTTQKYEKDEETVAWSKNIVPHFDYKLFLKLYLFEVGLKQIYPDRTKNYNPLVRRNLLHEKPLTISELIKEGQAACTEHAILAQEYLKRQGIDSEILSGTFVHSYDKNKENKAERHTWIRINTPDGNYFYDPTNPIKKNGNNYPRITSIEATQRQQKEFETKIRNLSRDEGIYLKVKSVIRSMEDYISCYGFCGSLGGSDCVLEKEILSKEKDVSTNKHSDDINTPSNNLQQFSSLNRCSR